VSGFGYPSAPPPPPSQPRPGPPPGPQLGAAYSAVPLIEQPQYMPVYGAPPAKPPLPRRQKTAATLSGLLLFPLISIGWYAMLGSVIAGFVLLVIDQASSADSTGFRDNWTGIRDGGVPIIVGVAAGGAVIWTLGLVLSRVALGASGHPRPWAVTWLGLLIAIAVSTVLDSVVVTIVPSIASVALTSQASQLDPDTSYAGFTDLLGSIFAWGIGGTLAIVICGLVVAVGSGLLGWRLMASAFRSPFADGEHQDLHPVPSPA
jgi:hypothetical protein